MHVMIAIPVMPLMSRITFAILEKTLAQPAENGTAPGWVKNLCCSVRLICQNWLAEASNLLALTGSIFRSSLKLQSLSLMSNANLNFRRS
jgi:hypothetical protein